MEKMLEQFDLKKEITDLVNCYFEPPFDWKVEQLGIYKYNGKLYSFCNYIGQGIAEPIYNGTEEYKIEITDEIRDYFDVASDLQSYTKKEQNEYIESIYNNVLEQIKEFELEQTKELER